VRRGLLFFGIAMGAACAVTAYALLRGVERALFLEPHPALLVWADRSPFVWRAAIALYMGGAAVFGGAALAERSPRAAAQSLLGAVAAAVLAIVVQGALWP
jgi:hypothetical protein